MNIGEFFDPPEIVEGSKGVQPYEAAHVFIPGHGRSPDGMGLNALGLARVDTGAALFARANLLGAFVMSGYKTPRDQNGNPWLPDDADSTERPFRGVPEAYSMDRRLDAIDARLQERFGRDVPKSRRRIEPRSINTVTNFSETEARQLFGRGDDQPVIIVAQAGHLERILERIAPRILRRPYMGAVVPEFGQRDTDSRAAAIATRLTLAGISTRMSSERVLAITDRRARLIWGTVMRGQGLLNALTPVRKTGTT